MLRQGLNKGIPLFAHRVIEFCQKFRNRAVFPFLIQTFRAAQQLI
ncbi:hypothetical protein L512_5174 [Bordetella bronchiseptica MBORD624]|nr:hypothetical protein L512_5174 [Bordetella bronchiseptica MBORD624]